jgi:hypothetical protein
MSIVLVSSCLHQALDWTDEEQGQNLSDVHAQPSTHAEGPNPRHSGSVKDFFKCDQYSFESGLPIMTQYHRLRQHLGWSDPEAWREMDILQEAIVLEFNRAHGTDASVLNNWKSICQILGARISKTILECKVVSVFGSLMSNPPAYSLFRPYDPLSSIWWTWLWSIFAPHVSPNTRTTLA